MPTNTKIAGRNGVRLKRALGGAYQFVEDESKDRWILAHPSDFVEAER